MKDVSRLRRAYLRLYGWATERLYHELAWAYEAVAWAVSLGQWAGWRREVLKHVVGRRILEIGFGTGALLAEAAAQGYHVVGVDPSRAMQRMTTRRLARRGRSPGRARARAAALPFADGTFDTVIATFPTAYVFDPRALGEIARVLARDVDGGPGRFVVTGLGSRSDRPAVQRAYGSLLGGGGDEGIAWFARHATALGYRATVVDASKALIRMPVVILAPQPASEQPKREGTDG